MRYLKKIVLLALSIALVASAAACAQEPAPTPVPATPAATPAPTFTVEEATPTPTPEPTPTPAPTPEVYDPQGKDALNGDPVANEYKPIIVQIDNIGKARPQTGPQSADIVFEMQVESTITRLMCVFNSKMPERIGPVRSARVYYLAMASEFDAMYAHFGGTNTEGHPGNIYAYMPENNINFPVRVDGLSEHYGTISRDNSRSAPHNAYLDTEKARALYPADYQPVQKYFPFSPDVVYADAQDAVKVSIPFNESSSLVEYVYDAENDVYMRSQGGKPFIDAETGDQISVRNLIVQYAEYTPWPGTQEAHIVGTGKAQFFVHGKVIEGTWEKESITGQTIYKDTNGKLVYLRPGNTWIHVPDLTVETRWEATAASE